MKPIPIDEKQTIRDYKRQMIEYCDELQCILQHPSCPPQEKQNYETTINNVKSFISHGLSRASCEDVIDEINKSVSLVNEAERKLNIVYMSKEDRINNMVIKVANIVGKDSILTSLVDKYKRQIDEDITNFPNNCNMSSEDRVILCNNFAQNLITFQYPSSHFSIYEAKKIIQNCNFRLKGKSNTPEFKDTAFYLEWFFNLVNEMTLEHPRYSKVKGQKLEYAQLFQRCVVSRYALTITTTFQLNIVNSVLPACDYKEMPNEWIDLRNKAMVLSKNKNVTSSDNLLNALQATLKHLRMGVKVFQGDFNWLVGCCVKMDFNSDLDADIILTRFMVLLYTNRHDEKILTDKLYEQHFVENAQDELLTKALLQIKRREKFDGGASLKIT